jgi:hypothetical protein
MSAIIFFEYPDNMQPLLVDVKYASQWIGCIETFDAGSKGRGVRSQTNMREGQIVLIEAPMASAQCLP